MHEIQNLKGKRWFIWTLVISIVIMGSLASYMYTTSQADSIELSDLLSLKLLLHKTGQKHPAPQTKANSR